MVKSEILREVMLENREEVMRHEVIKRRISLDGFDRQAIGVDALEMEQKETEIVGKIVIYLLDNGLQ